MKAQFLIFNVLSRQSNEFAIHFNLRQLKIASEEAILRHKKPQNILTASFI